MYMNRLITLLVLSALAAVAALVVREASATTNLVTELDSATLSSSWAESVEAGDNQIDSASRSYIAQAKAAFCNADLSNGQEHDSATRSYIAWARAVSAGESC